MATEDTGKFVNFKVLAYICMSIIAFLGGLIISDVLARQRTTEAEVVGLIKDVATLKSVPTTLEKMDAKQDRLLDMLIRHEQEGGK